MIEQAFYIQIANAILPEVTDLLNPFAFLTSHILARYAADSGFRLRVRVVSKVWHHMFAASVHSGASCHQLDTK